MLDTPGVRNFHLFHTGSQELQFLFPEIATRLPLCAYRSCLHDGESECAVKRALELGEIAETTAMFSLADRLVPGFALVSSCFCVVPCSFKAAS